MTSSSTGEHEAYRPGTLPMKLSPIPKKAGHIPGRVPPDQLEMPAAIQNGKFVSLGEVFRSGRTQNLMVHLNSLPQSGLVSLCVKRMEMKPDFRISILGSSEIDQKQAIEEIRNVTETGQLLIELELRAIELLVDKYGRNNQAAPAP